MKLQRALDVGLFEKKITRFNVTMLIIDRTMLAIDRTKNLSNLLYIQLYSAI